VIYDECHHLGARVFSKSLIKVQAPFYLGLSATPERRDHLDKVFKYFLGPIKYRGKFEPNNKVRVQVYSYNIVHKNFKSIYNNYLKRYIEPKMITEICGISERNDFLIKIIKDVLISEPDRKILFLSGRCEHLKDIGERLSKIDDFADNWGFYVGGMKRVQLDISSEKQIILGTFDMAAEGLDIPELDTLIFGSPLKGDITQTCGRIMRGKNLCQPLIIDTVDQIKPFSDKVRSRYRYYLDNEYTCEFYELDNGYKLDTIKKLETSFVAPTRGKKKVDEENEDPFIDD
jgi:superfamily II DNA or RNA helicase